MEIPLEKFFQIFSHGCLAAFDGMADGALIHALLPGDLAVALAEDQMCLHPDALHLRQRIEGVPTASLLPNQKKMLSEINAGYGRKGESYHGDISLYSKDCRAQ